MRHGSNTNRRNDRTYMSEELDPLHFALRLADDVTSNKPGRILLQQVFCVFALATAPSSRTPTTLWRPKLFVSFEYYFFACGTWTSRIKSFFIYYYIDKPSRPLSSSRSNLGWNKLHTIATVFESWEIFLTCKHYTLHIASTFTTSTTWIYSALRIATYNPSKTFTLFTIISRYSIPIHCSETTLLIQLQDLVFNIHPSIVVPLNSYTMSSPCLVQTQTSSPLNNILVTIMASTISFSLPPNYILVTTTTETTSTITQPQDILQNSSPTATTWRVAFAASDIPVHNRRERNESMAKKDCEEERRM